MVSSAEISEAIRAKREKKLMEESKEYMTISSSGNYFIMKPKGIQIRNDLIPYKSINSMYTEKDNGITTLKIIINGGTIKLKRVKQKDADKFILAVRKKIEETNKVENTSKLSPMDEIRKAKELLDMGALTEEEFSRIKEKYLEMV